MDKQCSKCGKRFPNNREYFFAQARSKDGLRPNCKGCHVSFKKTSRRWGIISPRDRKGYYQKNKTKILQQQKEYKSKNVLRKISSNLRTRLYLALNKGFYKQHQTFNLIGCTPSELKTFLESRFQHGMSWENYGKWHIDHIVPCAQFDLTKEANQRICFHYSNLQPLWAKDNLAKGCR